MTHREIGMIVGAVLTTGIITFLYEKKIAKLQETNQVRESERFSTAYGMGWDAGERHGRQSEKLNDTTKKN